MEPKPKILLVDDKLENIVALETVLEDLDVEFVRALSGKNALKETAENEFALALIDLHMPEMDGAETVKKMQENTKTKLLPIIYISAIYSENYYASEYSNTGAVDFISKPIIPKLLVNKVKIFLDAYKYRKELEIEIKKGKKADEKIFSQKEQLELMNKILRHDLINYFTKIKAALDLYNDKNDIKMMEEAYKSIDMGCKLISKMSNLKMILDHDTGLQPYDLLQIIETIKSEYPSLKFKISGKGRVRCNETIHSVFSNIFNNAIKHGNAENITIQISEKNGFMEIKIANDGSNIPEKIKDKIFDESFSSGINRKTGIGLYIVKKAIENFGGSIHIEDNDPRGVIFVILLQKAI